MLYETIKDLAEDFSFPNLNYMLAPNPPEKKMSTENGETTSSIPSRRFKTEDALPTGDIPNPRFYTGHILYIYNNVVKVYYATKVFGQNFTILPPILTGTRGQFHESFNPKICTTKCKKEWHSNLKMRKQKMKMPKWATQILD